MISGDDTATEIFRTGTMILEPNDMNLHQAAKDDHLPLVDTLVDFGYHVEAVDADGCMALFYAVEYKHRDIIELSLKN